MSEDQIEKLSKKLLSELLFCAWDWETTKAEEIIKEFIKKELLK